jgi:hypothetical protein
MELGNAVGTFIIAYNDCLFSRLHQPLAVTLVAPPSPSAPPREITRPPSIQLAPHYHGVSIPSWRQQAAVSPSPSSKDLTKQEDPALQVAVMVAMPSKPVLHPPDDQEVLPEYQIGVAELPWKWTMDS